jgi:hypothetical protein
MGACRIEVDGLTRFMLQALAMFSPQVTDPELVMCDNVTGVACSADGRHVLGNYLNNHVYLFSIDGIGLRAVPEPANSSAHGARRARSDRAAGNGKGSNTSAEFLACNP